MKSVVLCGSSRFKPEIREFARQLRELGVVTYEPYLYGTSEAWQTMPEEQKRFVALGLTHDHFYKMRMADIVFIYNKDGYVGNSLTMEIGYAVALGKPMFALHVDAEICRDVLFRGYITTPRELVQVMGASIEPSNAPAAIV